MNANLWKVRYNFNDIIGSSEPIKASIKQARIAANSDVSVLITGESGTGKEIFAQAIHDKSKRSEKPFVSINCSAISRELVEAELFGYAPGAYTGALKDGNIGKFQLADGGTLFLDEIGEMPLMLQSKLLRVISEKEIVKVGGTFPEKIDVRLIFATNRDLENEVAEKNFREDLYYRINTFSISIPPLRTRREDILKIANYILLNLSRKMGLEHISFSKEFIMSLMKYDWPGNVRELQGVIERELLHLSNSKIIEHIPNKLNKPDGNKKYRKIEREDLVTISDMESKLIEKTLIFFKNNIIKSSESLGIAPSTLYRKMKEYNLE